MGSPFTSAIGASLLGDSHRIWRESPRELAHSALTLVIVNIAGRQVGAALLLRSRA